MVVARKKHKCIECGGIIHIGERHEVASVLYDDHWARFRTCIGCRNARKALCPNGWYYGDVWSQIEECFREMIPFDDDDTDMEWLK